MALLAEIYRQKIKLYDQEYNKLTNKYNDALNKIEELTKKIEKIEKSKYNFDSYITTCYINKSYTNNENGYLYELEMLEKNKQKNLLTRSKSI
jgi:hypothetical protein